MLDQRSKEMLESQIWYIGTYSDTPNAVPVFFRKLTDDGHLLVADVFLDKTLKNIRENGKVSVSVCDMNTLEGVQVKGRAEYVTEGAELDAFKEKVSAFFKGAYTAKGLVVITPETAYVTTPGPHNNEQL